MNEFAALVAAGDEVAGTTKPTGRTAGSWVEFYEAIPGAGFMFWARPCGDSYEVVDAPDPSDGSAPTADYLDAWLASDLEVLPFDL